MKNYRHLTLSLALAVLISTLHLACGLNVNTFSDPDDWGIRTAERHYGYIQVDVPSGKVLVGAKNRFYLLELSNINATATRRRFDYKSEDITFSPEESERCVTGLTEEQRRYRCANHVRLVHKQVLADGTRQLFVCATSAQLYQGRGVRHFIFSQNGLRKTKELRWPITLTNNEASRINYIGHRGLCGQWPDTNFTLIYDDQKREFFTVGVQDGGDRGGLGIVKRIREFFDEPKLTLPQIIGSNEDPLIATSHVPDAPEQFAYPTDFVASFRLSGYYLFFFTELDWPLFRMRGERRIISRVARVCASDDGVEYVPDQNFGRRGKMFSTLFKATIVCRSNEDSSSKASSSQSPDFSTIRDVSRENNTFFAIFSTTIGSLHASALCTFDVKTIERALFGNATLSVSVTVGKGADALSYYRPMPYTELPYDVQTAFKSGSEMNCKIEGTNGIRFNPDACAQFEPENPSEMADWMSQNITVTNSVRAGVLSPADRQPLMVSTRDLFTKIQSHSIQLDHTTLVYISTQRGDIIKVALYGIPDEFSENGSPLPLRANVLARWSPFSHRQLKIHTFNPIQAFKLYTPSQVQGSIAQQSPSLLVGGAEEMVQIPVDAQCDSYTWPQLCIRDPHCGWHAQIQKCRQYSAVSGLQRDVSGTGELSCAYLLSGRSSSLPQQVRLTSYSVNASSAASPSSKDFLRFQCNNPCRSHPKVKSISWFFKGVQLTDDALSSTSSPTTAKKLISITASAPHPSSVNADPVPTLILFGVSPQSEGTYECRAKTVNRRGRVSWVPLQSFAVALTGRCTNPVVCDYERKLDRWTEEFDRYQETYSGWRRAIEQKCSSPSRRTSRDAERPLDRR